MNVIRAVNKVWGLECRDKKRTKNYVDARAQAVYILTEVENLSQEDASKIMEFRHRSTIVNCMCRFNSRMAGCQRFRENLLDVEIFLGLKDAPLEIKPVPMLEYEQLTINPIVRDIAKSLEGFTSSELAAFLPRIELYIKSVKYNRKQTEKWKRQTT